MASSDGPVTVDSALSVSKSQNHTLPVFVTWCFALVIPLLVAVTNFCMVQIDINLVVFKFDTAERFMVDSKSPWIGGLVLAAIGATYAFVASALVVFIAPACAGSGIPEAKGYLNGNNIPGFFTLKTYIVRTFGVVFSTASGFPVGREGPMVGIGGGVGNGIVRLVAKQYMRKWVKIDGNDKEGYSNALILDQERFAHALRVGTVMGSAAGLATAFNAPLGGILYMFEEVTVTNWAPELTFKCFVSSVLATLFTQVLMDLRSEKPHQLLIYDPEAANPGTVRYKELDVLFIAMIAALIGLLSVAFAKGLAFTWTLRSRNAKRFQGRSFAPYLKIVEAMLFAAVVAMVFSLIPSFGQCEGHSQGSGSAGSGRRLEPMMDMASMNHRRLAGLTYNQYTCEDGQINKIATLLLSGAEGAVKHLFATQTVQSPVQLILCLAFYFVLAMGMPGLPVPMGVFVPSLLIGSLSGRFFGEILKPIGTADPGVYAMCGAAAMLGGFTHMTLAIVVLLVEAANDLSLIPLLMLSISISHIVSTSISHHGYDEVLIHKKGVPFLDSEVPQELEREGCTAFDLMDEVPDQCLLPSKASLEVVREALQQDYVQFFPVVEENATTRNCVCVGITTRARLEAAVDAHDPAKEISDSGPLKRFLKSLFSKNEDSNDHYDEKSQQDDLDQGADLPSMIKKMVRRPSLMGTDGPTVPINRLMDAVPHIMLEDMPVSRFYSLYSCGAVREACIVSKRGEFRGILSRRNLISPEGAKHDPSSPIRYCTGSGSPSRSPAKNAGSPSKGS